mmetsp:Transcript_21285/g.54522  ORF Transcript_21285/g.54522 Transcript_21285/m.54522 type:complete len:83 (+) Transcript_21285:611-859(+)
MTRDVWMSPASLCVCTSDGAQRVVSERAFTNQALCGEAKQSGQQASVRRQPFLRPLICCQALLALHARCCSCCAATAQTAAA